MFGGSVLMKHLFYEVRGESGCRIGAPWCRDSLCLWFLLARLHVFSRAFYCSSFIVYRHRCSLFNSFVLEKNRSLVIWLISLSCGIGMIGRCRLIDDSDSRRCRCFELLLRLYVDAVNGTKFNVHIIGSIGSVRWRWWKVNDSSMMFCVVFISSPQTKVHFLRADTTSVIKACSAGTRRLFYVFVKHVLFSSALFLRLLLIDVIGQIALTCSLMAVSSFVDNVAVGTVLSSLSRENPRLILYRAPTAASGTGSLNYKYITVILMFFCNRWRRTETRTWTWTRTGAWIRWELLHGWPIKCDSLAFVLIMVIWGSTLLPPSWWWCLCTTSPQHRYSLFLLYYCCIGCVRVLFSRQNKTGGRFCAISHQNLFFHGRHRRRIWGT